ncbi:MAG: COG3014 family protein [Planctomycetota bacterium]
MRIKRDSNLMSNLLRCVLALSTVYVLSGCNAPKSHLNKFNQSFEAGDFEKARDFAEKKIRQKDTPRGEDLLWSLQIGSIDRIEKNYAQSAEMFDSCEEMMTHFDAENSGLGHTVGAVAVNENIFPYTGQVYDGVMVNTYKALNFISTGQYDLARVEFNRALDRQRRAKETFNQEIQKQKNQISTDENSENVQKSLDNPDMKQRLEEVYPSLYNFSVYPDFVNPFATYMAGLFFLIDGDYSKSVDLLKESAGMVPENTMILEDLDMVDRVISGGHTIEPMLWVIFENGLGPVKEEFRIDLPLFIATDNIRYVGIALPMLTFRQAASPYLEIKAGSKTSRTQLVADMDRVIHTEFEKDFKGTLTRAIISTTTKAIAQYALEKNSGSSWASVAMAVYSFVTTAADVRIWTALPKNFQAARLTIPENGILNVSGPNLMPIQVEIGDCNYAIVYVKMINAAHQPSIEIMTF